MKIKWNEVTRLSQTIAIVLFVVVYLIGMYVGMQIQKKKDATEEPAWAKGLTAALHSASTTPGH